MRLFGRTTTDSPPVEVSTCRKWHFLQQMAFLTAIGISRHKWYLSQPIFNVCIMPPVDRLSFTNNKDGQQRLDE